MTKFKGTLSFFLTKLVFLFMLIIVLVYSCYMSISTYTFTKTQTENTCLALSMSILDNISYVFDEMLYSAMVISNRSDTNEAILMLQDENTSLLDSFEYESILNSLAMLNTTTNSNYYVNFYDKSGNVFYHTTNYKLFSDNIFYNTEIAEQKSLIDSYSLNIFPPTMHETVLFDRTTPYLLLRPIIDPSNGNISGYVSIMCRSSKINSTISYYVSDFNSTNNGVLSAYLFDQNDELIFTTNSEVTLFEELDFNSNSYTIETSEFGWTLYLEIPNSYYLDTVFSSETITALISIIIVILIGCIVILKTLVDSLKPLKGLTNSMLMVSNGDYSNKLDNTSPFEDVSLILDGHNDMVGKIDTLVNSVLHNELQLREYRMKILKAQINPHFLFNTMQTIESLGEINDVPEVSEIASILGKLLRYSLRDDDVVSLNEELESIENYLKIMTLRFGHKLEYKIAKAHGIDEYQVAKFILQPIVENCIQHAFAGKKGTGHIIITSEIMNDALCFIITDNGCGIERSILKDLNQTLADSTKENIHVSQDSHIGIINVHRRINSLYGDPFGISIESILDFGTTITIKQPITKPLGGYYV